MGQSMDNLETLATLGIQDTGQTKHRNTNGSEPICSRSV